MSSDQGQKLTGAGRLPTEGLDPKRLARLMSIGSEAQVNPALSEDDRIADLLMERLGGNLPCDEIEGLGGTGILSRMPTDLLPMAGRSLGDVLLDPATSLTALQAIKDAWKLAAAEKTAVWRHAVAIALYYAAIASALRFHGRKITRHADDALAESFAELSRKPWMAPELAGHLEAAAARITAEMRMPERTERPGASVKPV
jgi:hypothetical protein